MKIEEGDKINNIRLFMIKKYWLNNQLVISKVCDRMRIVDDIEKLELNLYKLLESKDKR